MASFDVDCAVIGGGPAGLVSALYLGRYRRRVALFNKGDPRASWIPRTHNLLGYRGGISGNELLRRLREQVRDVGVQTVASEVTVTRAGRGFQVRGDRDEVRARRVILATGMQDVQPVLLNLAQLRRKGLLRYCPICDAFEYCGEKLVVLAQDDHGLRTALFLARFGSQVDVQLSLEQRIPARLAEKCRAAGIRFHRGKLNAIEAVPGDRGVWVDVDGAKPLRARVAYVALGSVVNDIAFRAIRGLERAEDGRLVTTTKQKLAVPGLFAVGDCVEGLAQISVAAGQAAIAATTIHNELREE